MIQLREVSTKKPKRQVAVLMNIVIIKSMNDRSHKVTIEKSKSAYYQLMHYSLLVSITFIYKKQFCPEI